MQKQSRESDAIRTNDLITQLGVERQNAERRYDELQDKMATLLKNAKEQAHQAAWH